MSHPDPERPWQPRRHDPDRILNPFERSAEPEALAEEHRDLEQLDELDDPTEPQDPPDPAMASDAETVANSNR